MNDSLVLSMWRWRFAIGSLWTRINVPLGFYVCRLEIQFPSELLPLRFNRDRNNTTSRINLTFNPSQEIPMLCNCPVSCSCLVSTVSLIPLGSLFQVLMKKRLISGLLQPCKKSSQHLYLLCTYLILPTNSAGSSIKPNEFLIIQVDNQKTNLLWTIPLPHYVFLNTSSCTITTFLRTRATNKNNFYFVFVALMSN